MNKMWLVAKREYLTNLKRPAFLATAFGMPIFILVIWIVIFALQSEGDVADLGTIGYVDGAGVLYDDVAQPEDFTNELVGYDTEDDAQQALDDEEIGAYFVVEPTYMVSGSVRLYAYGSTPDELRGKIRGYLLSNLVSRIDTDLPVERLRNPTDLTITLMDSGREFTESSFLTAFLTSTIFAVIYLMASQTTSGYLMSGIVEEKTNRVMEILITSITPLQMLAGKLLGLGALGLTQLLVWLGVALAAMSMRGQLDILNDINIPPDMMVLSLIYFVLSYFLLASIMAGVGVIVGSEQESRQYATIFSLLTVVPFFAIISYMEDPNGTLPIVLTLFPFTAGISSILRLGFSSIPIEQILASFGILILSVIVVTWASAKVFRWGTLLYGKKPTPRELFRIIRGSADIATVASSSEESA